MAPSAKSEHSFMERLRDDDAFRSEVAKLNTAQELEAFMQAQEYAADASALRTAALDVMRAKLSDSGKDRLSGVKTPYEVVKEILKD